MEAPTKKGFWFYALAVAVGVAASGMVLAGFMWLKAKVMPSTPPTA